MVQIELNSLKSFLTQRGVQFVESDIQNGTKLTCSTEEVFVYYPQRGKVVVQGQPTPLATEVEAWSKGFATPSPLDAPSVARVVASGLSTRIFVVYGHDLTVRDQLELELRRMGLDPIVLDRLPAGGDTIIEKLETYLGTDSDVRFACALLTPDDEGYPSGQPEKRQYRARQNVILELGMVLGRLGRQRVAILHKGSVELPSDIAGLIYIPFQEHIREAVTKLRQTLRHAGYELSSES